MDGEANRLELETTGARAIEKPKLQNARASAAHCFAALRPSLAGGEPSHSKVCVGGGDIETALASKGMKLSKLQGPVFLI